MEVQLIRAAIGDKPVLRNLFQLYEYEFSDIEVGPLADVNEHGLYDGPRYFDHYWTGTDRHPYLIRVDGKLAGFALVRRFSYLTNDEEAHSVSEFFVMRRYRLEGIGTRVATELFRLFPGRWEVAEMAANLGAQQFWRKVIGRFTGGEFSEVALNNDVWNGTVQAFQA